MQHALDLPVHPTKRHPLTGQPLQAVYVTRSGRVMWPILGGAPDGDDGGSGGDGGQGGGGSGGGAGNGGQQGGGSGDGPGQNGGGRQNATDAQGNDLGYPKDTPIAEMTDKEEARYWRAHSRKHEGNLKRLTGDRNADDVQKDLDELAEIRKQQQTPAEQALTTARDEGKAEGLKSARTEAAQEIFRGALQTGGLKDDEISDLVDNLNVANFVGDNGVDTTKITNFAKRFIPAGTGGQQQRRDFGGGRRREDQSARGSGGKAEAARRFKKTSNGE